MDTREADSYHMRTPVSSGVAGTITRWDTSTIKCNSNVMSTTWWLLNTCREMKTCNVRCSVLFCSKSYIREVSPQVSKGSTCINKIMILIFKNISSPPRPSKRTTEVVLRLPVQSQIIQPVMINAMFSIGNSIFFFINNSRQKAHYFISCLCN